MYIDRIHKDKRTGAPTEHIPMHEQAKRPNYKNYRIRNKIPENQKQ